MPVPVSVIDAIEPASVDGVVSIGSSPVDVAGLCSGMVASPCSERHENDEPEFAEAGEGGKPDMIQTGQRDQRIA